MGTLFPANQLATTEEGFRNEHYSHVSVRTIFFSQSALDSIGCILYRTSNDLKKVCSTLVKRALAASIGFVLVRVVTCVADGQTDTDGRTDTRPAATLSLIHI